MAYDWGVLGPSHNRMYLPFLKLEVLLISWAGKLTLGLTVLEDDSAFPRALAPFPHHFTSRGFLVFPNPLVMFSPRSLTSGMVLSKHAGHCWVWER